MNRKRTWGKKALAILLTMLMVLTSMPLNIFAENGAANSSHLLTATNTSNTNSSHPFTDVKETDWYHDAVTYAYENKIFSGTSATTFDPKGSMTRGMFVTVLGNFAGIDAAQYSGASDFSDVRQDAYFAPYVSWAVEQKITAGLGDGRFGHEQFVTREQMAVFMNRFFEAYGVTYRNEAIRNNTPPIDLNQAAPWAKEAIGALWSTRIFSGDGTGRFNPKNMATRAESAAFFRNVDNSTDAKGIARSEEELEEDKKPPLGVVTPGGGGGGSGDGPGPGTNSLATFKAQNFNEANGWFSGDIFVAWNGSGSSTAPVSYSGNLGDVIITPYSIASNQQTYGILKIDIEQVSVAQTIVFTITWVNGQRHSTTVAVPALNKNGDDDKNADEGAITDVVAVIGKPNLSLEVSANGTAYLEVDIYEDVIGLTDDWTSGAKLASGRVQIEEAMEMEWIDVTVSSALPRYFIVVATLRDSDGDAINDTLVYIKYTRAYEEYKAKTIYDFAPETVVNLDDAVDNNFMVTTSGVDILHFGDQETQDSVTQTSENTYLFKDAGSDVQALTIGERIVVVDEHSQEIFIIVIEDIIIDGDDIIIISEEDLELTDFFDLIKINIDEEITRAIIDMDEADEGVSFVEDHDELFDFEDGLFGSNNKPEADADGFMDISPMAIDIGGTAELRMGFNLSLGKPEDLWTVKGSVIIAPRITLEMIFDVNLFTDSYFYLKCSLGLYAQGKLSAGLKVPTTEDKLIPIGGTVPIAKIIYPLGIPGLVIEKNLDLPFSFELRATLNAVIEFDGEFGFTLSTYDGFQPICKKEASFEVNVSADYTLTWGPKLKLEVSFCKIVCKNIAGQFGIEAYGEVYSKHTHWNLTDWHSTCHECSLCLNADIYLFAKITTGGNIIGIVKWEWTIAEWRYYIGNAYLSLWNDKESVLNGYPAFGLHLRFLTIFAIILDIPYRFPPSFGKCPNYSYRTMFEPTDLQGNVLANASVTVRRDDKIAPNITGSGRFSGFLYPGTYTASVTANNNTFPDRKFTINDKAETIKISSIRVPVTGISMNKTDTIILLGEQETLKAHALPTNATNSVVTWESVNPDVATVDNNGTINAIASGEARIIATTNDGNFSKSCIVTVISPVVGVTLDKQNITLSAGGTDTLKSTINPSDATNQAVRWESSNTNVATVDNNGKVTAISPGEAYIYVITEDGGKMASCVVDVVIPVTGVSLNKLATTIFVSESETLTATISPSNATNQNVNWWSNDTRVVKVDNNGNVTAIAPGNATITASTADGRKTAVCEITVLGNVQRPLSINDPGFIIYGGPDIMLSTTGGNGDGQVSYWLTNDSRTDIIRISGDTISILRAGDVEIYAVKEADGHFERTISEPIRITVNRRNISDTEIIVRDAAHTYTGGSLRPEVTVKYGDEIIEPSELTFTITYENNVNAGNAMVIIAAREEGNYSGIESRSFTINKAPLIVRAVDVNISFNDLAPNFTEFTVTSGFMGGDNISVITGEPIFTCDYEQGNPMGRYTIYISQGTLDAQNYYFTFEDGDLTVGFTDQEPLIVNQNQNIVKTFGDVPFPLIITGGSGTGSVSLGYNVLRGTIVIDEPRRLSEYEYEISIRGVGEVEIIARKDACDDGFKSAESKPITIAIEPRNLIYALISAEPDVFTGEERKPTPTVVDEAKTLIPDVDFVVASYNNNINAGDSASVTIEGRGNYTGTRTIYFTINKAVGAIVTPPLDVDVVTNNSIIIIPVTPPANRQTVEYAISLANDGTGLSTWQTHTNFDGLNPSTTYYVYARSAADDNHHAGAHIVSSNIITSALVIAPKITTTSLPNGITGVSYNQRIIATGTEPITWSITGRLPDGLTFNESTGVISGTPGRDGTSIFTISAENSEGKDEKSFSITVATVPRITTESLQNGTVGTSYSQLLNAEGTAQITWKIVSGSLPGGLSLNTSIGVISGMPNADAFGSFTFTVSASNDAGSDTRIYTILINAIPPRITKETLPSGIVGTVYNQEITTTGSAPITWRIADGSLPGGLTLNTSTGVISGTPNEHGPFVFKIIASNSAGSSDPMTYSIGIDRIPTITTSTLANAATGTPYTQTIASTGTISPITWEIASGSLPTGLSINNSTGVISGNPTGNGAFTFTVRAANTVGAATRTFTILSGTPISTVAGLDVLRDGANTAGRYYYLTQNITLSNRWNPVQNFRGTLDGNGFAITNVYVDSSSSGLDSINRRRIGFFGVISHNVTIKNLRIFLGSSGMDAGIHGGSIVVSYAGGLVAEVTDGALTIENVAIEGGADSRIRASIVNNDGVQAYAGGFIGEVVGQNTSVIIRNSYVTVNVQAIAGCNAWVFNYRVEATAGGFVGRSSYSPVTIENSYISSNVTTRWHDDNSSTNLERWNGEFIGRAPNSGITHTVSRCYFRHVSSDGHGNHHHPSRGATHVTTDAAMGQQSTFVGWDFANIWEIRSSRPHLRVLRY